VSGATPIPESLQKPFLDAIRDYRMIVPGDRVLVAVSGGKDSFTLLHLFGRLQETHFPDVEFIVTQIKTDIT
jgi:tRNA 2-thiocytidine biosynthesis protein TtcA